MRSLLQTALDVLAGIRGGLPQKFSSEARDLASGVVQLSQPKPEPPQCALLTKLQAELDEARADTERLAFAQKNKLAKLYRQRNEAREDRRRLLQVVEMAAGRVGHVDAVLLGFRQWIEGEAEQLLAELEYEGSVDGS